MPQHMMISSVIQKCFFLFGEEDFDWPTQSSDLNLIHRWDELECKVRASPYHPILLLDLPNKAWEKLNQKDCAAVIWLSDLCTPPH